MIHNLYVASDVFTKEDWLCGTCSTFRELRNMRKILPGSLERRPLGRPRSRWVTTLKCTPSKYDAVLLHGFKWFRYDAVENALNLGFHTRGFSLVFSPLGFGFLIRK
jgi:hypothetical protein